MKELDRIIEDYDKNGTIFDPLTMGEMGVLTVIWYRLHNNESTDFQSHNIAWLLQKLGFRVVIEKYAGFTVYPKVVDEF